MRRSKEYISGALSAMLDLGSGAGPMNPPLLCKVNLQRRRKHMEEKRTTLFENGLIWFGAAVPLQKF